MKFSFIQEYLFLCCLLDVYAHVRKDVFLGNKEIAELLSANIISREQIMQLPCIRRDRRCFAHHIKRRGWKNQKHVNDFLNKKLNIKNEEKFIEEVLKLMIADNSDTLRASNDEELHFTKALIQEQMRKAKIRKKRKKQRRKKQEKRSRETLTVRSEILDIPDFINTYKLNEFNLELKPNTDPLVGIARSDALPFTPIESSRNRDSFTKRHEVELNPGIFENDDENDFLDDSAVNYQGVENTIIEKDVPLVRVRTPASKIYDDDVYSDVTSNKNEEDLVSSFDKGTVFDEYDTDFDVITDNALPTLEIEKFQLLKNKELLTKLRNNLQNENKNNILQNKNRINNIFNDHVVNIPTNENTKDNRLGDQKTKITENRDTATLPNLLFHDIRKVNRIVDTSLSKQQNSSTKHSIENDVNGNTTTLNSTNQIQKLISMNTTNDTSDILRNFSRTAQENMYGNRSKEYPINSKTILKKLNINIKTSDAKVNDRSNKTSLQIENNTIRNVNSNYEVPKTDKATDIPIPVINNTSNKTNSFITSANKTITLSNFSNRNSNHLNISSNKRIENALEPGNKTVNGIAREQNIYSIINKSNPINVHNKNNTDKEGTIKINTNNSTGIPLNQMESFLENSTVSRGHTYQNKSNESTTYKNKNSSTDIGSKRHFLTNISKNSESDLDSDFDFEDTFDNSLESVVTASDSEIDDGNSGNSKDDIVIESNENFVSDDQKNRSRVFKMHLKDANSLTTKNFQTVHWNFDDNFNWDDYINQYPFNVNFPTSGNNLFQSNSPTVPNTHVPTATLHNDAVPVGNTVPTTTTPPHQESLANYIITTPGPSKPLADSDYPTRNISWALDIPKGRIRAKRVCKPGANKPFFTGKNNCLIIGDSIALSYSYSVAAALRNDCQVQLAPLSKAGVALDSKYGLDCLDMFLSTKDLQPTYYDVIIFNFGLHDIDYLRRYPEEYNNITSYIKNLKAIKTKILETGATAAFVLSTPVTFDVDKDNTLKKYNHAAKRVMEESPHVMTVNLHKLVVKECGPIPFANCYMMKKPNDVHYGVTGSIMLGKRIAYTIKYLLRKRNVSSQYAKYQSLMIDISSNSTQCTVDTHCPASSTCMNNLVSRTGIGCCRMHRAIDCGDSWHCCPHGTVCHPACSDKACSCIK